MIVEYFGSDKTRTANFLNDDVQWRSYFGNQRCLISGRNLEQNFITYKITNIRYYLLNKHRNNFLRKFKNSLVILMNYHKANQYHDGDFIILYKRTWDFI